MKVLIFWVAAHILINIRFFKMALSKINKKEEKEIIELTKDEYSVEESSKKRTRKKKVDENQNIDQ